MLPMQGARVQSLVGKVRSCMSHRVAKKRRGCIHVVEYYSAIKNEILPLAHG